MTVHTPVPHRRLRRDDGAEIAYCHARGESPTLVFLSGFRSDMSGTKALHLEQWARDRGRAYLRLDYRGHGYSSGRFEDGTIGAWAGDARAVIEAVTAGPLVLVGSSMGAWIAILAALAMPERVRALVGIAAAPDFTEDLLLQRLSEAQREEMQARGVVHVASEYDDEPTALTRALVEEARDHLVLRSEIRLDCPVRLVHGLHDADVPWERTMRLVDRVRSDDVRVILVKDGEHRLSRPQDLDLVCETIAAFA